jgi:hypothetical protein
LKWNEKQGPLADAEVEAACRVVTFISEGDVDAMRALVASYAYKPYARAQIATSLNYTFYLAGVEYRMEWYGSSIGIEHSGLRDGQFGVSFTPLNDEPAVTLMTVDPKYPQQFATGPSSLVTAKEALAALKLEFVRDVLEKQAEKKAKR